MHEKLLGPIKFLQLARLAPPYYIAVKCRLSAPSTATSVRAVEDTMRLAYCIIVATLAVAAASTSGIMEDAHYIRIKALQEDMLAVNSFMGGDLMEAVASESPALERARESRWASEKQRIEQAIDGETTELRAQGFSDDEISRAVQA